MRARLELWWLWVRELPWGRIALGTLLAPHGLPQVPRSAVRGQARAALQQGPAARALCQPGVLRRRQLRPRRRLHALLRRGPRAADGRPGRDPGRDDPLARPARPVRT